MLTRLLLTCSLAAVLGSFATQARAEEGVIPYQGILNKGGQPYTGTAEMKFAIVDQSVVLWSNDHFEDHTLEPRHSVAVQVADGQFCVSLGAPPMEHISLSVLARHPAAVLRVWVSTGGGAFEQLSDQSLDSEDATREGSKGDHWSLRGNRDIDPAQEF